MENDLMSRSEIVANARNHFESTWEQVKDWDDKNHALKTLHSITLSMLQRLEARILDAERATRSKEE